LQSGDEVNLMNAVAIIGPISVAVDATNLQFYKSGFFHTSIITEPPKMV